MQLKDDQIELSSLAKRMDLAIWHHLLPPSAPPPRLASFGLRLSSFGLRGGTAQSQGVPQLAILFRSTRIAAFALCQPAVPAQDQDVGQARLSAPARRFA